jgi:outer membrane protein assembly complex protein YaeT
LGCNGPFSFTPDNPAPATLIRSHVLLVQGEIRVNVLRRAIYLAALFVLPEPLFPQTQPPPVDALSESLNAGETPVLDELRFTGLRRISPAAVAAQIASHRGNRLDPAIIDKDVRVLARLGWFESIQVEAIPSPAPSFPSTEKSRRLTLIFRLQEFPILSKVDYSGSQLLSPKQIEKMLEEKKLTPQPGKPADPAALQRAAYAIRNGLNELGHPHASVQIAREETSNATVRVCFEINDGPLLRVRSVAFDGHPQVSTKLLRAQMDNIAPWKPLASLRGKNAYTRDAFEEDRQRILTYYQDHGFPEARVGNPRVVRSTENSHRWLPWPHNSPKSGLAVSIPVEAGPLYHFKSGAATEVLRQSAKGYGRLPFNLPQLDEGRAYSQQEIDKLRRLWAAQIQTRNHGLDSPPSPSVDVTRSFNPEDHTARVTFDLSDSPQYVVQRIKFLGLHKFSDRFVRRKILLREGRPVDERALEAGLLRLARTGYFKPIHKEDIRVQLDETAHTANVTIRLQEIGQQRATFAGGTGQFGSTLGIAYTVFDLLNREELLSAQLDGGPESLQIALGLAEEGIFGTRASLAFSVFNNVIRPRFATSAKGPFFTAHTEGITIPWTYPLTGSDLLGVNLVLSRATSEVPLGTPPGLTGLPPLNVQSRISSHSLGVGWAHDMGSNRFSFSNSASGGWLGGGENMVRSSAEYDRIFRDPFLAPANAWAFRTTFSGAGSYRGDMPYYARFFSGDEFVRGLRPGELGPYARTTTTTVSGATNASTALAGANLLGAANAEYRIPLGGGIQAAAFFDLGSGLLLPNWLGPTKPLLLGATNGVLHGSTGIEFRWTVPEVQVPVRAYYAINVLRLDRFISLSGKSRVLAHDRFSAFGWGLGSLF